MIHQLKKSSPVYEPPVNAGSRGRVYCTQPFLALQEVVSVIRTHDLLGHTVATLPLH